MMDKVFIQNLRAKVILGIHDWERVTLREIIINATMFIDTSSAAQTDDISDCVNYSEMSKKLRAHAESAARMTVEALANDLAQVCLQEPRVARVILRVDKPGAVVEADSVAVEVERRNPNSD
ncbi:MAG: dihydroneopterin aldolase [Anaerolineales bacterium]|nr:dihydroneopterin aldolase [Anaerolineales bacterium]